MNTRYVTSAVIILVVTAIMLFGIKTCTEVVNPPVVYNTGTTTHDTTTIRDTIKIPFPVIKYVQKPNITIFRDREGETDTLLLTDTLFKNLTIAAKTDTTIASIIYTKFGDMHDTLSVSTLYLFPENTMSFTIKRNDQNIEKLIQTIINTQTITPVQQMSFWEKLQWSSIGFATGVVIDRIVK